MGPSDVKYLVLADRAIPYLLARVRWPDTAQAISARRPDWLDDQGLFDLPYDPSAVTLSFPQAASVAASWGRQLQTGAAEGVPSYIRRMPANWSDLSPSVRRAWGIEDVGSRRGSVRRARRLRRSEAKTAVPSAVPAGVAQANGHPAAPELHPGPGGLGSVPVERRHVTRARVDGRAHIRCGQATISAGLVDLGEGGVRCVLPEASPLVGPGAPVGGPFLLESEISPSRICLDVTGRISWQHSTGAGLHFGVAFGQLAEGETEGLRRFLTGAGRKRGPR